MLVSSVFELTSQAEWEFMDRCESFVSKEAVLRHLLELSEGRVSKTIMPSQYDGVVVNVRWRWKLFVALRGVRDWWSRYWYRRWVNEMGFWLLLSFLLLGRFDSHKAFELLM